jgi:hypothetical protein
LAAALGITNAAVTQGRATKALLNRICRYAAENGHDISDILAGQDAAPRSAPIPAQCAECQQQKVTKIDSHQALVARFEQKGVAEEINRYLLNIEQINKRRLVEIRNIIKTMLDSMEIELATSGKPEEKRAGRE